MPVLEKLLGKTRLTFVREILKLLPKTFANKFSLLIYSENSFDAGQKKSATSDLSEHSLCNVNMGVRIITRMITHDKCYTF